MNCQSAIVAAAIVLLAVGCKESDPAADSVGDSTGLSETFEYDSMVIENDAGKHIDFKVYLALEHGQHRQGLMHVRDLPEKTGMLFVYGRSAMRSIWMKNTFIPLDIIFVRADGTVSSINRNATPLTLNSRSSKEAVKYVIELNAGAAERHNIGTNSRLIWRYGDDQQ